MIVRDDHPDEIDDGEGWGDEDGTTEPCPVCGGAVDDDAGRCPICGHDVSGEGTARRKPGWVVAGVAACLAMVTWWILHP